MNFKVIAVLVAFVVVVCAASPASEPQQEEIGKHLMKDKTRQILCYFGYLLLYACINCISFKFFSTIKIQQLSHSLLVISLDPMHFALFVASIWDIEGAIAMTRKSVFAVDKQLWFKQIPIQRFSIPEQKLWTSSIKLWNSIFCAEKKHRLVLNIKRIAQKLMKKIPSFHFPFPHY